MYKSLALLLALTLCQTLSGCKEPDVPQAVVRPAQV